MTKKEMKKMLLEHEITIETLSIALEEAQRTAQRNAIELTKHFTEALKPTIKKLIREELKTT